MKKKMIIVVGIILSLVLFSTLASAQSHGSRYSGGRHYSSGWGHGHHSHGFGWGFGIYAYPGWWGSYPYPYQSYPYAYYPYPYRYPYYAPPPATTQEAPSYSEQEQPYYWYYCQNPEGYYPYVKTCPGGWMKVVPNTTPPNP